jgi:hypothetical protein
VGRFDLGGHGSCAVTFGWLLWRMSGWVGPTGGEGGGFMSPSVTVTDSVQCTPSQQTSNQVKGFHYTKSVYRYVRTGTHLTGSSHLDSDGMYMTCATHVFNLPH